MTPDGNALSLALGPPPLMPGDWPIPAWAPALPEDPLPRLMERARDLAQLDVFTRAVYWVEAAQDILAQPHHPLRPLLSELNEYRRSRRRVTDERNLAQLADFRAHWLMTLRRAVSARKPGERDAGDAHARQIVQRIKAWFDQDWHPLNAFRAEVIDSRHRGRPIMAPRCFDAFQKLCGIAIQAVHPLPPPPDLASVMIHHGGTGPTEKSK